MRKVGKFTYWTPRILSILFICFLAMFSLDVFSPGLGFWQIALGLLMHNIPTLFLLAVLIVSWKHEIVGGIVFILAGFLYIAILMINAFRNSFQWYMISWSAMIAGPAFLIGILFLVNWFKKKKRK
jgi:hypothetical protein